ncbi:MAG: hypothetical protein ACO3GP_02590 [Candidatus Limnocylindrus sp.]
MSWRDAPIVDSWQAAPPVDAMPRERPLTAAEAIPFLSPEQREYLGQTIRNVRGGVVEGLGAIGSTFLRPTESAEENARRRALIEQFVTERMGAEPESIGRTVGSLGITTAGTAGIGPTLGLGAKAAQMPQVARAFETAGFGGQGLLPRVAAGGTVGGLSAAAVDPADLLMGAGMGAGLPYFMAGAAKLGSAGAGKVMDALGMGLPQSRASNILREAIGEQNLPNALAALRAAGVNELPDETLIGITRPAFISLVDLAAKKDPDNTVNALRLLAGEEQTNELARIAGGLTQTEARRSREAAKLSLRGQTAPMREEALTSAGLAGRYAPGLETDVSRFQGAAGAKVEDVRMLDRARQAAQEGAATEATQPRVLMGQRPDMTARYLQMDEAGNRFMDQAAEGSLNFGAAARLKQYQLDSLAAEGLQPLKTADVVKQIRALGAKPETAGNDAFETALAGVVSDIQKWTDANGVIDPYALEAIRKNSVASVIRKLYPNETVEAQRQVAAGILSDIKPIIDDAIEAAGGKGWRSYLNAFQTGMAEINQLTVAAQALKLFDKSPDEYVRLVRGNRPEDIEKVFGRNNYDIVKEMGARYPTLDKLAKAVERRQAINVAVQQGREPIEDILKNNRGLMKLPAFFDPTVTAGNKMLTILGAKVDTKTMDVLMKAVQSNQNLLEALQRVPARQRNIILKTLSDDRSWIPAATAPITSGMAISAGQE